MIKKFIDKLLGKSGDAPIGKARFGKRQEVVASVHGIDPALVAECALSGAAMTASWRCLNDSSLCLKHKCARDGRNTYYHSSGSLILDPTC